MQAVFIFTSAWTVFTFYLSREEREREVIIILISSSAPYQILTSSFSQLITKYFVSFQMCLNVKIILVITKVVTSNSNASVDFLTNTYENANYYYAI